MDAKEANIIIESYGKVLGKGTIGETSLRKASWLPYSKAKIKYAYFTLLESIFEKDGKVDNDFQKEITGDYSQLNSFVVDDVADKYVKIYQLWQTKKTAPSKKDEQLIKQYIAFTYRIKGEDLLDEINEYIDELGGKK